MSKNGSIAWYEDRCHFIRHLEFRLDATSLVCLLIIDLY